MATAFSLRAGGERGAVQSAPIQKSCERAHGRRGRGVVGVYCAGAVASAAWSSGHDMRACVREKDRGKVRSCDATIVAF